MGFPTYMISLTLLNPPCVTTAFTAGCRSTASCCTHGSTRTLAGAVPFAIAAITLGADLGLSDQSTRAGTRPSARRISA